MRDDHEELPAIHPVVLAQNQVIDAMSMLDRHPDTFLRWPFPDLDAMTGPMAPGNVWFVVATSGGGKTTFVSSVVEQWRLQGKRVYVMALETRPREFRTYLACMATGVHPGDALSGQLLTLPNGGAIREQLKTELLSQVRKPYVDTVMVSGARAINMTGLMQGFKEAKAFNADVVIVDHIDHIEGGDGSSLYSEAKRVNDGALVMAQDNDLLVLFTSQMNMSVARGDYMSKFLPPKVDQVAFGSLKERNATGMIGLFRPVRAPRHDEDATDYTNALKSARAGTGDVAGMLEPNTMGVVAMKLRNYGSREGMKVLLAVKHGRVSDMPERDQWSTAGRYPRKVSA